MKLRHFSSGLKPVPVDHSIYLVPIWRNPTCRQLSCLTLAINVDPEAKDPLLQGLVPSADEFGQKPVPKSLDKSKWLSNVSNEHSFFK